MSIPGGSLDSAVSIIRLKVVSCTSQNFVDEYQLNILILFNRLVDLVEKVQHLQLFLACQLVQLRSLSHLSSRLHLWGQAWQDQMMTIWLCVDMHRS